MLISPGSLVLDELLAVQDCKAGFPSNVVAYDAVVPFKMRLLERAWKNFEAGRRKDLRPEYDKFCAEQGH